MRNGFIAEGKDNLNALVKLLPSIKLNFVPNEELGFSEIYLNGENVEKEIRTLEVSRFVSRVAEVEQVRHKLVEMQKALEGKKVL